MSGGLEAKLAGWTRRALRALPRGLEEAVGHLLFELWILAKHLRGRLRARRYAGASELRLNLGCGSNVKPGWVNIDLAREADLALDLRKRLPFRDGSCALVYSEHFFEHLVYPGEADLHVREAYRVLRPGGVLSLGVPDAEETLLAYVNRDDEYFRIAKERWHPSWCKTPMDHVNYAFRQGTQHKYAWDFETLERLLSESGFSEIRRRDFDPVLDSSSRQFGTLYVDAVKADSVGETSPRPMSAGEGGR